MLKRLQFRFRCNKIGSWIDKRYFGEKLVKIVGCQSPNESLNEFNTFCDELLPLIKAYMKQNNDDNIPLFYDIERNELIKHFYNQGRILPDDGIEMEELKHEISTILTYTNRSSKPKFMGKLYSGSDAVSQFASLLLSIINTNVHTFDASPSLTCVEKIVVDNLCKLFYKDKWVNTRGGIFVPGGSYANTMGIRIARDAMFPNSIMNGYDYINDGIPIVITSDVSHYGIETTAVTLGIGKNNVIKIESNLDGSINIDKLREYLESITEYNKENDIKKRPFIISGTAGTTYINIST